ncbi:Dolichol kinase EVAN [Glycine max]|nr:Dolichol kinase EVAN [Glycine max]
MSSELVTIEYEISRSEISIIIQGFVLGLLLYPIALKYILQIWEWFTNTASAEAKRYCEIGRSLMFVASLRIVLILIVPSWMVLSFVFSEPSKRLTLCIYWVCVHCLSLMSIVQKKSKFEFRYLKFEELL